MRPPPNRIPTGTPGFRATLPHWRPAGPFRWRRSQNAGAVIHLLNRLLHALNDLALTLKHVHGNVVGPHFIAVHEMLDPQVEAVRGMGDETAERISTLGGEPHGTPGAPVAERSWDDYDVGRAGAMDHLGASISCTRV
jgi:starvation-inducible DNA-binding protein